MIGIAQILELPRRKSDKVAVKWVMLATALALAGCQANPTGYRAPEPAGQTVQVRLEGVTARQYVRGELHFEFFAPQLVLDEKSGELVARGGVRGRLEPGLWKRDDP